MISLATRYLGLDLAHPVVPGASPLGDDLDTVLALEDAGACAIVMRSIFEEQIALDQMAAFRHTDPHLGAEASSVFPETEVFALGLDAYLNQIRRIRARTSLKVIGSLNGTTPDTLTDYARRIEAAGAEALELNVYHVETSILRASHEVERAQVETVRGVCAAVRIPVTVKLSPDHASLPHFVAQLGAAGACGVVLFNRFYQSDIDPVALETVRALHLSTSDELLQRLRWIAILSAQTGLRPQGGALDLALSGGAHTPTDVIKGLMAGASIVQTVSALLRHGAAHLRTLIDGTRAFLEANEYSGLDMLRGSMNRARTPNPAAYERADYIHLLQSWHGTV